MNLKSLSDQELLEATRVAAKNERHSMMVVLYHLREVEARRLFGPTYKSLHEYAVKELRYSGPSAQRRLDAMRVLKVVPEVDEKIESGSLNLTTLSQVQTFFRQESKTQALPLESKREILAALEDQPTRQVDRELIKRSSNPKALKKDRVRAVSDTLSEMKCLVTDEALEDLKKLRGLLAHKHPDLKMGELIAIVAKVALEALDPGKEPARKKRSLPPEVKRPQRAKSVEEGSESAKPAPQEGLRNVKSRTAKPAPETSRYIPAPVQREVWRRAENQCQLCRSTYLPQVDHIIPIAQGGLTVLENLRLLCFHCNQREADAKLGRPLMDFKRAQTHTGP